MKPEQISAIALEVAKDMSVAPSDYLHHDALPELCTRFLAAFTAKAEPFSTLCVWRHGNIEMITDSPPEDTDYKTVDVFLHPAIDPAPSEFGVEQRDKDWTAFKSAAPLPDDQLCQFYDVDNFPDLVAAMEHHIEKLQAKLPPTPSLWPGRVREG